MVFRTIQISTVAFTVYINSARDLVRSEHDIVAEIGQIQASGVPQFERKKVRSCLWLSSGV